MTHINILLLIGVYKIDSIPSWKGSHIQIYLNTCQLRHHSIKEKWRKKNTLTSANTLMQHYTKSIIFQGTIICNGITMKRSQEHPKKLNKIISLSKLQSPIHCEPLYPQQSKPFPRNLNQNGSHFTYNFSYTEYGFKHEAAA